MRQTTIYDIPTAENHIWNYDNNEHSHRGEIQLPLHKKYIKCLFCSSSFIFWMHTIFFTLIVKAYPIGFLLYIDIIIKKTWDLSVHLTCLSIIC